MLAFTELYKYYENFPLQGLSVKSFLAAVMKNFEILYTGNLFWFTIFLISIVAIINIFLQMKRVDEFALKLLFIFSVLAFITSLVSILIPEGSSPAGSSIPVLPKGIKSIALCVFGLIYIFLTVSLCVVSFSVLMKLYIFRSIWITLLIVITGFAVVFLFAYNYKDDYRILIENKKRVDAGTVLGAAVWGGNRPSPVLRERINKGYELYSYGIIKYIILTGGGSPGEMTEADVSKKELLKKGVEERNIFVENKSNSTLEQIYYLSSNLYKKNNWKEIVIISDNFHLLRTKQICRFFGINAYTVASDTPLSTESNFNFCVKESFAVILFWLFGIG
jgi:vancomycin permeability regulator SanA